MVELVVNGPGTHKTRGWPVAVEGRRGAVMMLRSSHIFYLTLFLTLWIM
jgi:hypothetical protein